MTKEEAQQVVDDLDSVRTAYAPDEYQASLVKAAIDIATRYDVISDDTELEYVDTNAQSGG